MFDEKTIIELIDEEAKDYIYSLRVECSIKEDSFDAVLINNFVNALKSRIHFASRKNGNSIADSLGDIDDVEFSGTEKIEVESVESSIHEQAEDSVVNNYNKTDVTATEDTGVDSVNQHIDSTNNEVQVSDVLKSYELSYRDDEQFDDEALSNEADTSDFETGDDVVGDEMEIDERGYYIHNTDDAVMPDEDEMDEPLDEIDNSAYYLETNSDGTMTDEGIVMSFCDFLSRNEGQITDYKVVPLATVLRAITDCGMWESVNRTSNGTKFGNVMEIASFLCVSDDVDYNYVVSEIVLA